MQRHRILIGLALWLTCLGPAVMAADAPAIARLKDFHLQTDLAPGGAVACAIVIPADASYAPLGERLAGALAERLGARPAVVRAGGDDLAALQQQHLVAVGVFANNPVLERLYLDGMVYADWSWPRGDNAYELRTVHNPWRNGRNVIAVSSVTPAGCAAAVERLVAILAGQAGNAVGPLIEVSPAPAPLDDAAEAKELAKVTAEGSSRTMGGIAASYADRYFTSGQGAWARLFLAAMRRLDALHAAEGDASDLRTCRYLFLQFDRIEEGPAFSDADRRELTDLFLRLATRMPYSRSKEHTPAIPHGNDWNAIAASYAGLYFSRYYPDLEIGQKLLRNIEALNAPNMAFWKVNEDCPGYGNITLTGNCDWALARPVPSYFQDGHLRQMVDFDMLITDNQGRASGIGDFSGFSTYQVDSYLLAAWLYKDGRYLWWWDRFIGRPARFWVPPEVLARQVPEDLVGIRRAPLDNWLYQSREPGRQGAIPQDRCFDKVSFRSGLEPADQYLCLSGLSYGFHAHADANAIVRYADQGRVCLYDDGYMIPTLSEHNTVIILKDGWAGRTPDFSEVTAEAESDRTGLFESRLDAYNGVAWDRAVIWSKGRHFLVIDDLRALEASRYSFQCLWRALGRTRLEGRRWTSEKDGSRFSLLVASDAALSLRESAGTSLNSPPFPLHEARALVQSSAHDLAVGQSAHFANLFYTESTEAAPRPVEVARAGAGATTWFVRDGDEVAAAGIHACQGVDGVGIDADVFHLTAGHLLAAGLRSFRLGEMSLTATGAVSLDLDLATGTARLRCDGPATLTGPGAAPRRDLAAGESALALAPWPAAATAALAGALSKALRDATAADTAAAPAAAGSGDGLRQLWRYADFRVLAPASSLPGTRLHSTIQPLPKEEVGHGTGRVEDLLQSGANIMFRPGEAVVLTIDFPEARPVHEVVIASRQLRTFQGGCGLRRVVVSGSSDGFKQDRRRLAEVSHDKAPEDGLVDYPAGLEGKPAVSSLRLEIEPWSPTHRIYLDSIQIMTQAGLAELAEAGFQIHAMATCDLDGDGRHEVLAGGTDRIIHAIGADGTRRWQVPVGARINAMAIADSRKAGGGLTVAAACEDKTLYAVNADGRKAFTVTPPPRTYARPGYRGVAPFQSRLTVLFSTDLEGDGLAELVVGSANWRTYVYDHRGELRWDEVCWAHTPTCGAAFDLDGDGRMEVVMGNTYAPAVIYSAEGKVIGSAGGTHHAGPTAIACADLDGNGKGEVIVGDRSGALSFREWQGRNLPTHATGSDVTALAVFDADGDGRLETAAASRNQMLYLFDADGQPIRQMPLLTTCRSLAVADLLGDRTPELIAACEDGQVKVLSLTGEVLARFAGQGWMRDVAVCDLDGNPATREIVVACDDGSIYALQITP